MSPAQSFKNKLAALERWITDHPGTRMTQTTAMPTDWGEEWHVGWWIRCNCQQKPQSVPEEHRAAFEAAVTRSGYGQVSLATRARPSAPQCDAAPTQCAGQGHECGCVIGAWVVLEEVC
mmetsp:Transcript_2176/g.5510  ORF Transcript_2176/g.5510 Transcript_2176/m.5510 type:complete len:119 (-) Transcript_2176:175-531(-)